jgi:PAS domain S-box-containing protein
MTKPMLLAAVTAMNDSTRHTTAAAGFKKKLILVAAVLAVLAASIDVFLQMQLRQRHTKEQETSTSLRLASLRAQLEGALNANLLLISGAASFIATNPNVTEEEFTAFAREIMRRPNLLINLGAAPDFTFTYVYPREGNEAIIGLNYRDMAGQWEQARKAKESGRMELAGPLELVQGGIGLIGRAPVILAGVDEGRFWGLVSAVIDVDRLFEQVGLGSAGKDLRLAIRGKDGKGPEGAVFHGNPALFSPSAGALLMSVTLPSGSWQIAATPVLGWSESPPNAVATHLVILALLVLSAVIAHHLMAKAHQLRLVRESLGQAQALAHLGSWEVDTRNKVLWWSDETFRIFGENPGEFIPTLEGVLDMVHPEDREAVQTEYLDSLREKTPYSIEYRIVRPSGQIRFVHEQGRNDFDAEGTSVRSMGTIQDITERKQVEEELRESQREFRAIADYSYDWESWYGTDGSIRWVNPAVERVTGYTAEECKAMPGFPLPLVVPEDRENVVVYFRAAVAGETGNDQEFCLKTRDEGETWVAMSWQPIQDEEGQSLGFRTSVRDITARKEAEEALRKLTRAVEQSQASIVITGKDGAIEYVNPHFCHITGYAAEEALGQNPRVLKSGQHSDSFYREMWETLAEGYTWSGEVCNKRKDGSLFWEHATISPLTDEQGRVTHHIAVKEDITERKDLEQLREDVDRIMRHDLKTPLNGIIGLPQLMLEDSNLTEEQLEYLNLVMEAGYRMLKQINLSLDLYKMETGTYQFGPAPVDLGLMVSRLLKDLGGQAKAKNVMLEVSGECPCMAMAEELLSHSMLSNILLNSVEASPEGGTVTVRIEAGEDVAVSVHNMGVVPESIRDNFFEKYTTHGKIKGTGLGTYSAKLMAETQGGAIGFTTSEQAGTTVTIRLPKDESTDRSSLVCIT